MVSGSRLGRGRGRLGQLVAEQLLQLGHRVEDQPQRPGRVVPPVVLGVRQPLHPVPLGHRSGGGDDRDAQVVGRVEGGELGQQRPGQVGHRRRARRAARPG